MIIHLKYFICVWPLEKGTCKIWMDEGDDAGSYTYHDYSKAKSALQRGPTVGDLVFLPEELEIDDDVPF